MKLKKTFILAITLIIIALLFTGCQSLQGESKEKDLYIGSSPNVWYELNDQTEIFGNISREEISNIQYEIAKRYSESNNPENEIDSIIEETFKEYGITDQDKIDAAKAKLNISIIERGKSDYNTFMLFPTLLFIIQAVILFSLTILGIYTMLLAIKAFKIYIKKNS